MANPSKFLEDMRREVTAMQDSNIEVQDMVKLFVLMGWMSQDFDKFFPPESDISAGDFMAALELCSQLEAIFESAAPALVKMRMISKAQFVSLFRQKVAEMTDHWSRVNELKRFFSTIGWDKSVFDAVLAGNEDLTSDQFMAVIAAFDTLKIDLGADDQKLAKMKP